MLPGDLAPVVATLVEASDPSKVSANALAVYALDASQARPTAEVALVASMAPSPLDTREEVVGVVGVLIDDVLKPREMRLSGANAAYVTNLAVASRARRKGIASDLLHEAEVFAKNAGCQTIWCRVDAGNTLARQMYERRGYAPREPVRLLRYRKTVATAYLVAGMAHFFDFVAGPSALPIAAGAPEFAAMSAAQQTLALLWCFTGPLAFFANVWSEKTNEPRIATAGLVVYGVFETSIAGLCAYVFGAKGTYCISQIPRLCSHTRLTLSFIYLRGRRGDRRGVRTAGGVSVLPSSGARCSGGENNVSEGYPFPGRGRRGRLFCVNVHPVF
tara:strand:+ start:841 stop:1833 length:993 start_codon:yes stop_codon:yes gene_type:complete